MLQFISTTPLATEKTVLAIKAIQNSFIITDTSPVENWLLTNFTSIHDIFFGFLTLYICFKDRNAAKNFLQTVDTLKKPPKTDWVKFDKTWYLKLDWS